MLSVISRVDLPALQERKGAESLEHGLGVFATGGSATESAGLASRLEFAVALGPDDLLAAGEDIVGRDVADGAVKADAVVVVD
jgi:hypothetical protein